MRLAINGRFLAAAVTGVQRFAREVACRLPEFADVTLLLPAGCVAGDWPTSVRRVRGRMRGHAFEQLELPALAKRDRCDITLHLSGTLPVRGGPHIGVLHDVLPLTHPQWFSARFARWYAAVLRRAVPRAAGVITVSESSRREIERVLHPERIAVVTQGLAPFDAPAGPDDVLAMRAGLRLPDRFLLATGRGDPRKNHGFVAAVLADLQARRGRASRTAGAASWTAVFVGTPAPRVHGRRPDPRGPGIRLIDRVDDRELRALYTAASVLCFPSLAEGFGRPPLEAAACGTPSIVADHDGIPDVVRAAALAVPLEAAAWADAVEALDRDDSLREACVARGRRAGGELSWAACASQVADACEAALMAASKRA